MYIYICFTHPLDGDRRISVVEIGVCVDDWAPSTGFPCETLPQQQPTDDRSPARSNDH